MKHVVFSVEKYEDLNEDKWRFPKDDGDGFFALCDGASESFDSRGWAALLANGISSLDDFNNDWLAEKIREFEAIWQNRNLTWSQQIAFERGSFSTLLGVQFHEGKCEVSALGDTNAFSVNGKEIVDKCPYTKVEQFLDRPLLLSTLKNLNIDLSEERDDCPKHAMLDLSGATHVLLLTDAIAHWLMKHENEPAQIRRLLEIENQEEFAAFVAEERKKGMRFDDTTMIRINLDKLPSIQAGAESPV